MSKEKSNSVPQILDQLQALVGQAERDLKRDRGRVNELREKYQLLRRQGGKLQQQLYQYSERQNGTEPLIKDQLAVTLFSDKEMDNQE